MLDVVRIVGLLIAASACLRPRYWVGLAVFLAIALVDAPAIALPMAHREAAPPTLAQCP